MIHVQAKGNWRAFVIVEDGLMRSYEREPEATMDYQCDFCGDRASETGKKIKSYGAVEACADCLREQLKQPKRK